ncbi:MAG: hypothetical protein ACRDQD_26600 [Nocardioidaceae bacterium]
MRRYKPSELIPALATWALEIGEPPYSPQILQQRPPWAIAAAARESILYGNEHRDTPVDARARNKILQVFNNVYEMRLRGDPDRNTVEAILTRIAYEQFPYQESIYEEVARSHALLVESLGDVDTQVVSESAWASLLGAPLADAVASTFFLQVGANENNGRYDPGWLDQPNFSDVLARWPREHIEATAARLTADFAGLRSDFMSEPTPVVELDRYGYNPLVKTPFIALDSGIIVAPQPRLILRTITPGGLYYTGIAKWGNPFAEDLGKLVEHYVGRQLRLIENAEVHPEVVYGRPEKRSVDWFAVLPDLVILVEVKSSRLTLRSRAGDETLVPDLQRSLGKATEQLATSVERVRDGHAAFAHIPNDRPFVGLIVTAEPFYTANSTFVRQRLGTAPVPTLAASLRDLEHLLSLDQTVLSNRLSAIVNDPEKSTWKLGIALGDDSATGPNPILEHAWSSYPWPFDVSEDE